MGKRTWEVGYRDARRGNASWMPYCARGDAVNTGRFDSVRCIPPESCSPPWRRTASSRSGIALRKDRSPTRAVLSDSLLCGVEFIGKGASRPTSPVEGEGRGEGGGETRAV